MITKKAFQVLLKPSNEHMVSIYMPTHQASPKERNQDKIRLKNLLDEAEADLTALGDKRNGVTGQLRQARNLLKDEPFWQQLRSGLVLFISAKSMKHYHLPVSPQETVVTAKRYHIKPLLPLLDINRNFYVLCVSLNKVRLFKADPENIAPVEAKNLPEDINDALGEDDNERSLQHNTADSPGGRSGAVFHGHGGAKDLGDVDPPRFIRAVAGAVGTELANVEAPLVFAGDDKLFFLFQEFNRKVNLLDEHLSGNHDDVKPDELHRKAREVVLPHFRANIEAAAERYSQVRAKTPKLAEEKVFKVTEAALSGKVEELLLDGDREKWGHISPDGTIAKVLDKREPGAVDLFDVAAAATLEHKGTVYTAARDNVPGVNGIAAILRYR